MVLKRSKGVDVDVDRVLETASRHGAVLLCGAISCMTCLVPCTMCREEGKLEKFHPYARVYSDAESNSHRC